MKKDQQKNTILYINTAPRESLAVELKDWFKQHMKVDLRILVLVESLEAAKAKKADEVEYIVVKFDDDKELTKVLQPIKDSLLCVSCYGEANISRFRKVIPHVPYLRTPTEKSLRWATNKIEMRRRFAAYNKKISPKFMVIHDSTEKTIQKVGDKIKFPVVIKPAGLMSSLLVTDCHYEEELKTALRKMFRSIKSIYKKKSVQNIPEVLVEEFMEGDMYSIDGYVTSRGKVYCLPPVSVKTGKDIGIDDFFNYLRITPTTLAKKDIEAAEEATRQAIHALGLRSTTIHIELLLTNKGWKIIELGPRIGGFRDVMYEYAFGIPHRLNDALIRIPKKPIIPKKVKGYCAVLRVFPKKPGVIEKIEGLQKARKLTSVQEVKIKHRKGDKVTYSKYGGTEVGDIILFNKDRSALMGDIRRIEKTVNVKTK